MTCTKIDDTPYTRTEGRVNCIYDRIFGSFEVYNTCNLLVQLKMADDRAMKPPTFISSSAVQELVSMRDIVEAMGPALMQYSQRDSGAVVQPVRTVIPVQDHNG